MNITRHIAHRAALAVAALMTVSLAAAPPSGAAEDGIIAGRVTVPGGADHVVATAYAWNETTQQWKPTVGVESTSGTYALSVPPGTYRVLVSVPDQAGTTPLYTPAYGDVTVAEGATVAAQVPPFVPWSGAIPTPVISTEGRATGTVERSKKTEAVATVRFAWQLAAREYQIQYRRPDGRAKTKTVSAATTLCDLCISGQSGVEGNQRWNATDPLPTIGVWSDVWKLKNRTTYEVRVRAIGYSIASAWSPWTKVKTPPATPAKARFQKSSATTVNVACTPVPGTYRYRFAYRLEGASTWSYAYRQGAGARLKNLSPKKRYQVKVAALDTRNQSSRYTKAIWVRTR